MTAKDSSAWESSVTSVAPKSWVKVDVTLPKKGEEGDIERAEIIWWISLSSPPAVSSSFCWVIPVVHFNLMVTVLKPTNQDLHALRPDRKEERKKQLFDLFSRFMCFLWGGSLTTFGHKIQYWNSCPLSSMSPYAEHWMVCVFLILLSLPGSSEHTRSF